MTKRGQNAFAAAGLIAAISIVVWLLWSARDSMPVGGTDAPTSGPVESSAAVTGGEASPVELVERRAMEVLTPAPTPPADELALFRGRAVDAGGQPLSGVTAKVRGWTANHPRLDVYRVELEWINPDPVVTGNDGRFEIAFAPPPSYRFTLELKASDLVTVDGRYGRIEPGTVKDFGDVVIQAGARVSGRFVDADGSPVVVPVGELVRLAIDRYSRSDRTKSELTAEDSMRATVSPDGTFEFAEPACPGLWNVSVQGLLPEHRYPQVEITAPDCMIQVVVVRPEALLRISGVVVDEAGQTVPRAKLMPLGTPPASSRILRTERDGTFEIVQHPDVDIEARFGLMVAKGGHRKTTVGDVAWGQDDLRIVLPRIPALEVLVVRAADRTPVEEYELRMLSIGSYAVIDGKAHPNGITRVKTLERGGEHRIYVEPHESTGLASVMQRVEVDAAAPSRLTIALPEAVEQPIRVVHVDGTPAAGTRVELVDSEGEPFASHALVLAFDSGVNSSTMRGTQIAATWTDADGRCTITGPPDVPLTIRCTGDHPSLVEDGVRLTEKVRELRLAPGATVTIRIEPSDVLAEWRRAAGLPPLGPIEAVQADLAPKVRLWRPVERDREFFPAGFMFEGIPFSDAGVAVLHGVPAGTWHVTCRWRDGIRSPEMDGPDPLAVAPGGKHEFVLDASAYRVGSVSGRLTVEGGVGTGLRFIRTLDRTNPDGSPATEHRTTQPESDGSFATELAVGTWAVFAVVRLQESTERGKKRVQVRAYPDIVVVAGSAHTVELRAEVARTELRIVDPAGDPVAGLRLSVLDVGVLDHPAIADTDADGRTVVEGNPGRYRVTCRIRSQISDEVHRRAWQAAVEAHGGDFKAAGAALNAIVELPDPIVIPAPSGRVVEIRLPESWDR